MTTEGDPSSRDVTPRQREVFEFISRHIEARGIPPSIREIGEAMGIRSTNGVADHIKALERKGLVSRDPRKSRTLRLVQPDPTPDTGLSELAAAIERYYPGFLRPEENPIDAAIRILAAGVDAEDRAEALPTAASGSDPGDP